MTLPLIHEAFRAVAGRRPDAVAVVHGDVRVTYRELDAWSDRLSVGLVCGPGSVVPVVLPPGPELVAVLLAVLKRGAAYAVLDPAWPDERLRRVAELLPGQVAATPHPAFPARVAGPALFSGDAAMVFFTSGSTGEPKAVLSPHRGTTRLFDGCTFAEFDESTVMNVSAALPWDAFALELWGVLTTGGTAVLADERPLMPAGLRAAVSVRGVNTVFLTTSLFHLIVEEDVEAFAGLRTVMVGGERLSPSHAARFLEEHPDVRLVNGYGPVESTVFVLSHDVRVADVADEVPLGRPVPHTSVVVLRDGRVCAPGEVGELCVAGEGLASGYLGDDALTAAKFVVVDLPGGPTRVYRTGDLGSVGVDGLFRFHGRADRQVKVRGHRVEPTGIEHLAVVAGVRRAVVVPVRDETGACVALALFHTGHVPGLVDRLRADLPAYSVPDHVVEVEAFPLLGNGKTDTRALLDLLPRAEPGGDGSDAVVAEFASVLGVAVDRDASFFESGGTSLAAIRLCTRLGRRFGRPVPVSRLVRTPTAAGIAAWLASEPVSESGVVDVAELTPMQHGFLVRHLVSGADPENHCPLVWRITGALDADALVAAVSATHRAHGYLSGRYTADEEAVVVPGNREVEFVFSPDLDVELRRPLRLADGVVWRAVLTSVGPSEWLFGVVVHHVAFDGWSQHLLARSLSAGYRGGVVDAGPSPIEAVSASRALVDDLPGQREYWREALRDLPSLVLPPGGDPGPDLVAVPLSGAAVERFSRGRLPVVVDAVARALAAHTGQRDFGIGVPVAHRSSDVLSRVIGCLVDMVCVRVGGDPVAAVEAALAHADVPVAEVSRLVRRGRDPLYRVIVVAQDSPPAELDLPGCVVTREGGHDLGWPMADLLVELDVADGVLRVSRSPLAVSSSTVDAVVKGVVAFLEA
ncbi:AMP-binding protein [Saccharothrix violaceirubra]|uniref:Acyl-coenzyme A synthetase/AMP-(Fatty) acid ligase n=1 Tax=Saccharothrix violaceirubra TaxID=413306 RepID=A0A7W7T214_9PSEU|nr:AMP-binding protein [Saccharothrix violaceirubra]MBB4965129.1 acyl-coenzyme A synthetase/AMP-(fatty) acid ligase [Saccharothrix violaceirubra]